MVNRLTKMVIGTAVAAGVGVAVLALQASGADEGAVGPSSALPASAVAVPPTPAPPSVVSTSSVVSANPPAAQPTPPQPSAPMLPTAPSAGEGEVVSAPPSPAIGSPDPTAPMSAPPPAVVTPPLPVNPGGPNTPVTSPASGNQVPLPTTTVTDCVVTFTANGTNPVTGQPIQVTMQTGGQCAAMEALAAQHAGATVTQQTETVSFPPDQG